MASALQRPAVQRPGGRLQVAVLALLLGLAALAWLLTHEQRLGYPPRWLLRAARGVLALTPLAVTEPLEAWLIRGCPTQQMLALAVKE